MKSSKQESTETKLKVVFETKGTADNKKTAIRKNTEKKETGLREFDKGNEILLYGRHVDASTTLIEATSAQKAVLGAQKHHNKQGNREPKTLKKFFEEQGLEVIDKRPSGGRLWITGDKETMQKAVSMAKDMFGATGKYASGKATKQRPGWYTDSCR